MRDIRTTFVPDTVTLGSATDASCHTLLVTLHLWRNLGAPVDIFATSACGVRFDAERITLKGDQLNLQIRIPRLDQRLHESLPICLHLCHSKLGAEIVPPLNIFTAICAKYPSQRALDALNNFELDLTLTPSLGFSVLAVNGRIRCEGKSHIS